jgi:putative ABC transport system permease protein
VGGDAAATSQAVQRAIWALDPDTPIAEAGIMTSLMRSSAADDWFRAIVTWTLAGLAAALTAVGIFGVTARLVALRATEIAIRSALGAERWSLVTLVLRESVAMTAGGLALGLFGGFWASRLLQSFLYGVQSSDPLTYSSVVVLVGALSLAAAYLPARRVTRIVVMQVLGR